MGHRPGRRKSNAPQSSAYLLDRRERERDSEPVFLSCSLAERLHSVSSSPSLSALHQLRACRLGLGLSSGLLRLRYRGPGREPGSPLGEKVDA